MASVIVGDPSVFALESSITQPYERLSQRALGFFVIHVAGACYGVRSSDATLLACSFDAVQRRIAQRGKHCVRFDSGMPAAKIVQAFRTAWYDEPCQDKLVLGMACKDIVDTFVFGEIVWAPDGDEAFDDGGHVLQFDIGDRVRLIAFKDTDGQEDVVRTLSEVSIDADAFYRVLDKWQSGFESEWTSALKLAMEKKAAT